MKIVDRKQTWTNVPRLIADESLQASLDVVESNREIETYQLTILNVTADNSVSVKWCIPCVNIKGVWSSNSLTDKHIRADWELPQVSSCISIDVPVMSAFGHDDSNRITYAVSDTLNVIHLETSIQEEDGNLYCQVSFDTIQLSSLESYTCLIRIDRREEILFSDALQSMGQWLAAQVPYPIQDVPEHARWPVYSTWYSYHQNFTEDQLLTECRRSKNMGYEVIIVDDGWQTMDNRRGYDYTGDWEAERFSDMAGFVEDVHDMGMKIMCWYSVPFCGKKSKAYKKFKGKFLTENHPWAPVFDPRFPEVRSYLVSRYVFAVENWNLDGFKLDFIDDFHIYTETEMEQLNGRDVLSVNKGVELLIQEIKSALTDLKPDILIEFRQKYISPALRTLGNMFRAFDCPHDSVLNRIRTTDVKLLCGHSAVHSDMITWHKDEHVELAALQFTSILFSVPQISVRLDEISTDHARMLSFYTNYWREHRSIFLDGQFRAYKPMSNYPILEASNDSHCIYGVYEDIILNVGTLVSTIDIVNGKMTPDVIVQLPEQASSPSILIRNCMGETINEYLGESNNQLLRIKVPANGLIRMVF